MDILILVILCWVLNKKVKAKGRKSTGYVWLVESDCGSPVELIGGFILGLMILMVTGETVTRQRRLLFRVGFALGRGADARRPFVLVP